MADTRPTTFHISVTASGPVWSVVTFSGEIGSNDVDDIEHEIATLVSAGLKALEPARIPDGFPTLHDPDAKIEIISGAVREIGVITATGGGYFQPTGFQGTFTTKVTEEGVKIQPGDRVWVGR